jgi:hypothetical protein
MNYSEWLLQEFPELADSSSVKRFNYVKKAKTETRYLCFMANIPVFLCFLLFVYGIGYVLGKYTNVDLWVVISISVVLSVFVFSKSLNKIERRIVQKKLTELVGENA